MTSRGGGSGGTAKPTGSGGAKKTGSGSADLKSLERVRSATVVADPRVAAALSEAEAAKSGLSGQSTMEERLAVLRKQMAATQAVASAKDKLDAADSKKPSSGSPGLSVSSPIAKSSAKVPASPSFGSSSRHGSSGKSSLGAGAAAGAGGKAKSGATAKSGGTSGSGASGSGSGSGSGAGSSSGATTTMAEAGASAASSSAATLPAGPGGSPLAPRSSTVAVKRGHSSIAGATLQRQVSAMIGDDNGARIALQTARSGKQQNEEVDMREFDLTPDCDGALKDLADVDAAAFSPATSNEFFESYFKDRPNVLNHLSKGEKDIQKIHLMHERATSMLLSQLELKEKALIQEQKDKRSTSEAQQAQETAKLEALHQERYQSLLREHTARLETLSRDQAAKAITMHKEFATQQKAATKESLKQVKTELSAIKKDKNIPKSDKKQRQKIVQARHLLIVQQRHQLQVCYADQAAEIDRLMEKTELEIENMRIQLYFRLLQMAQLAQLGNNYLQQRQWAEMELSTQIHKHNKESRSSRFQLASSQLDELVQLELSIFFGLLRIEKSEFITVFAATEQKMTKEHERSKAEKVQAKESELAKLSAEIKKFSKSDKKSADDFSREQKKQMQKLQGELDTFDTLFKRDVARTKETEVSTLRQSWKQRWLALSREHRRRRALLKLNDEEEGKRVSAAAKEHSAQLQAQQVAETQALHAKHIEQRTTLETDKIQNILSLKKSQIAPLQQLMATHAQASGELLSRHKCEAESEQVLIDPEYLAGLKMMHNEAIEKARKHALDSGRNLRKNQELLWTRWEPPSSVIKDISTANAELNDSTLASFLSGTQTPRNPLDRDAKGDPAAAGPVAASSSVASSSRHTDASTGVAFVHGRSREQEYLDKICFDTGLGPELVHEIIGRIGTVRETEIFW